MKPKNTATDAIRKHLKKHGSITQLRALEKFGTWRLSSVIHCLRNEGMEISTDMLEVKTRYGVKTRVAKYILAK